MLLGVLKESLKFPGGTFETVNGRRWPGIGGIQLSRLMLLRRQLYGVVFRFLFYA